jgi:metal-sulfur cluster biosynthetic enzyme
MPQAYLTPSDISNLSEEDVSDALRACFCTHESFGRPLNIVDLGLVGSLALAPDPNAPGAGIPGVPPRQTLELGLLMASEDEAANCILLAQILNRLSGIPQLSRTSVEFLDSPRWTPDRITPQGRRLLNLDPTPFPILNNRVP